MNASPSNPPPDGQLARFRWPFALIAVVGLALVAAGAMLRGCQSSSERMIKAGGTEAVRVIQAIGQETGEVLARFNQGTITRTFTEALPTLSREPGGRLELGALKVTEVFSGTDNLKTAWGLVDLGTTVTEIRVPATYRYYLRLHDAWQLEVRSNICIVHAPVFRAAQPPAINTAGLEKKSTRGWARLNADSQMAELERDITPTLARYANDPRHREAVREECLKTVAEFVRDWLLRENQWRADRFNAVRVYFPDENPAAPDGPAAHLELK